MRREPAQPSCSSVRNRAGQNRTSMENIVLVVFRTPTIPHRPARPHPNDELRQSQKLVAVLGTRLARLRSARIFWRDSAGSLAEYSFQRRVVRDRSAIGERNLLASLQWALAGILPARNDRGWLCLSRLRQRWLDGYLSGQQREV